MAVKLHETKTTAQSAIEDGLNILSELKGEVEEVCDGMPESLQGGSRYETLSETKDALGEFCDETPDFDAVGEAANRDVTYGSNRRRKQSRSDRRDEACRMLDAGLEGLRAWADEQETAVGEKKADGDSEDDDHEELEGQITAARELADEVEGWKDSADGVEFPGMYG
jgi:hypothetical protein